MTSYNTQIFIRLVSLSLLVAVLSASQLQAKAMHAKVKGVKGTVQYQLPDSSDKNPLKEGMVLKEGTRVFTGTDASVVILVVPGAALQAVGDTDFTLGKMFFAAENGKTLERIGRINLEKGTVSTLVKEGETDVTNFKIITPYGSASAQGTFYGVSVRDGKMYTKVLEGYVTFQWEEVE